MSFETNGQQKVFFWYFICAFPHILKHICFEWSVSIMEWSYQRHSEVLTFGCVNIRSCIWICLHTFTCTDLGTSVEYVCCSCFHLSFNISNNETDVGWKYMCINIGIYRNLIHITWYVELESCLPRKEAITKLMWALDRELEAELGAFIFFCWSAVERRKKWKEKRLLIQRNTFIEQINLLQSSDTFFSKEFCIPFSARRVRNPLVFW